VAPSTYEAAGDRVALARKPSDAVLSGELYSLRETNRKADTVREFRYAAQRSGFDSGPIRQPVSCDLSALKA
jgi:hypothetical protein